MAKEEKIANKTGKPQDKGDKQADAAAKAEKAKAWKESQENNEVLVRILGFDIPGSRNLHSGLTRIKGVSWAISNATCINLGMQKTRKISDISKPEIQKIEEFLRNLQVPDYLKNRRLDQLTGETKHYLSSDLDVKKEFDIKRLKEIKSYRGLRHSLKLPSRGQRTRSHFRSKGIAMGIKKKAKA